MFFLIVNNQGFTSRDQFEMLFHSQRNSCDKDVRVSWCRKVSRQKASRPDIKAPTDAVVKITKTTIYGPEAHLLEGGVPAYGPGRFLGHEGLGVVQKLGSAVKVFKPSGRVLVSWISACVKCTYCRRRMYSHCTTADGSWAI